MDETLEALKRGIVANPEETFRWLVLADYLEETGRVDQAELLRLHRQLLENPFDLDGPNEEHNKLQSEVQQRLLSGVKPFTITQEIMLPGEIPMTFAWCPPGSFQMGSNKVDDDAKPVHAVRLTKGFWMGVTPVTQAQWQAIMEGNPSNFKGLELPVETVSWDDAIQFCQAVRQRCSLEVRLPTEAEWEYACRAGTTSEYWSGNGADALKQVGWFASNSGDSTQSVGQLAANPWGFFDIHGNVWEWCSDWYGASSQGSERDPTGPKSGSFRLSRGGSSLSGPLYCRSAFRSRFVPTNGSSNLGFRLVFLPSE
jgi:uncharacterized protein (TIGR02996 family)